MHTDTASSDPFAWSLRPYGRVFNNLTILDTVEGRLEIAQIHGSDLMAAAAAAGARTAIFDSRNQWYALHDSSVCLKHPGLGERDLTAEIIDAGKSLGIQYVPYIPVDCDRRAFDEHTDWRNVDFDGHVIDQVFPRVCENSPFAEYMASYLADLLRRYDINGLWFDGLGVNTTCYCRYCREGFRNKAGREAPRSAVDDPETWKLWLYYKHEATQRVFDTLAHASRAVRPGVPIHTAWESGIRGSSQSWIEAYWKWPTPFLQLMRSDAGAIGEFYIPAFQYAPSYPISLTQAELRDRAMIAIANGTIPTFTLTATPSAMLAVNGEIEARTPWLVNADPVPYVAVVHSERSKRLCERDEFKDGPDFTLYGTVMPLLEENIIETCISDDILETGDLNQYAAIVLPDISIISETVAEKLRAYVHDGGGLVASYRTSLCRPDGSQMADFDLADLFGVHFREAMPDETILAPWSVTHAGEELPNKTNCKFLKVREHPIVDDELIKTSRSIEVVPAFRRGKPSGFDLPYPGPAFRVGADSGVTSVLEETFQQPETAWPVMTARQYGKGRVVYIAANLGFHYAGHWSYPFVRRLQTNAVRWVAQDNLPPVQVESPHQVHTTLFRQRVLDRLIVHLLNSPSPQGYPPMTRQTWDGYFTSFGRMREDIAPVYDIRVRFRGEFKRISIAPGDLTLATKFEDGWTEVNVPRLNVHIMVVAEEGGHH